jgi:hypothetical protein
MRAIRTFFLAVGLLAQAMLSQAFPADAPRTFRFFLDGYAGWSRIGTTVETFDVTSDGFVIGPGLGVEIPFAEKWNVIARGHYYYQSYGDVLLNEGINAGSADNAWRWGGQVGLSFGPIN